MHKQVMFQEYSITCKISLFLQILKNVEICLTSLHSNRMHTTHCIGRRGVSGQGDICPGLGVRETYTPPHCEQNDTRLWK